MSMCNNFGQQHINGENSRINGEKCCIFGEKCCMLGRSDFEAFRMDLRLRSPITIIFRDYSSRTFTEQSRKIASAPSGNGEKSGINGEKSGVVQDGWQRCWVVQSP
uniref:Uncharacterized protein n=1 Tax=Cryptomonas curvata TaxID=233186 RepID=A0A7S0MRH2_9CRYP|mmetsp:Transcript_52282/g.109118  ORF Transcript_52282/g.109118 Transcript_52282/m.109118 type:complete len:106 (+) Transcript_52282:354-671(+)